MYLEWNGTNLPRQQGKKMEQKLIDIDNVFRSKNPKLLKLIPRFLISYLKKIAHEDELNGFLESHAHLPAYEFVDSVLLDEFGAKVISEGLENIPKSGKYIIAANHPLGGPDGMALIHEVTKVREDLVVPVNDLLMNVPNLRSLFIPINKHGSNAENVKIINDTFASDSLMLYFPAGLVSRKKSGHISDLPWKSTFLKKAIRYKRDIIPTHISGRNSNFFYNLANLRERLGIKLNIEMLYLVNEMYKQRDKTIKITFGKPISYQTFDKRMNTLAWSQRLREHIYDLEKDKNSEFKYKFNRN